jgi:hypothetical protein
MSPKVFLIALVCAGGGGTTNLFYSFYLRDKQIGMSARIAPMSNPLRETGEKSTTNGYVYVENKENRRRFRSWLRIMHFDQTIFFWFLASFITLLFIFASLAVLHPRGIIPAQGTLIWDEAVILGEIWGQTGRIIFLIVGVATLFSTQLAIVDGVSRSISDIIWVNFPRARSRNVGWWYIIIVALWIISGCVITAVMERYQVSELGFIFHTAYIGGFAMAIYVPLTLYVNYRYLPKSARPGVVSCFFMIVASFIYIGFSIACIRWEIMTRWG